MTRRHDETTGKWFDEDMERCSACYLNHGHNLDKHIDSIADRTVSAEMKAPLYAIRANNHLWFAFSSRRGAWLADNKNTFVLYDTARI